MKFDKDSLLLYAVTDRSWTFEKSLYEQVKECLKGKVSCVQLREKDLSYKDFLKEATEIGKLCKKYNVPFIVNDNVEIAIKSRADGVHIGQKDMDIKSVRKLVGEKMIVGVSVHNVKEAKEAVENGANYLGVGAMFSTSTKLDAKTVSLDVLKDICRVSNVPVVAIGGINKNNIDSLSGSGVNGVALVSAIFGAEDIKSECESLYKLSKEMVERGEKIK